MTLWLFVVFWELWHYMCLFGIFNVNFEISMLSLVLIHPLHEWKKLTYPHVSNGYFGKWEFFSLVFIHPLQGKKNFFIHLLGLDFSGSCDVWICTCLITSFGVPFTIGSHDAWLKQTCHLNELITRREWHQNTWVRVMISANHQHC